MNINLRLIIVKSGEIQKSCRNSAMVIAEFHEGEELVYRNSAMQILPMVEISNVNFA